jgi:hypothetical protein
MNHSDWPAGTRTLDLSVDDLPHASSGTEWWYLNLHLRTTDGGQFSAFVAFSRTATLDEADRLVYSHTASWAIVDVARKRYIHESLADAATIDAARDVLSADIVTDWRVRQALLEAMESGEVPLPDRRLRGEVSVAADRLDLRYGNSGRFHKDEDGNYQLTVIDVAGRHGLTVTLTPSKGPVRHGTDGTRNPRQGLRRLAARRGLQLWPPPRYAAAGWVQRAVTRTGRRTRVRKATPGRRGGAGRGRGRRRGRNGGSRL